MTTNSLPAKYLSQLRTDLNRRPPFRPHPFLKGPHAQTLWFPFWYRRAIVPLTHEDLPTPDGDKVSLHHMEGKPDSPLVLILHGLEGNVNSSSVQLMLREISKLRWGATALEFRGCDGRPNTAQRLYHSGETTDLDHLVRTMQSRHPGRRLYAVAFSLGANVLGKWIADQAETCPLSGAVMVSTPFDLATSATAVDTSWNGFYARTFLKTLKSRALAKAKQYPGVLNDNAITNSKTLVEYDNAVTAPLHGFKDAAAYYTACACGPLMDRIRIPLALISSADDPLVPADSFPHTAAKNNPWLYPFFSEKGGHIGFVDRGLRPWAQQKAISFLRTLENNIKNLQENN